VSAQLLPAPDAATPPEKPPAALSDECRRIPTASPPKAASLGAPTMLLERARALFAAGDVQAALHVLASPDSRGLRGLAAEGPRRLLHRICAAPEVRGAHECAEAKADAAVE
jgi:hypothetical protein